MERKNSFMTRRTPQTAAGRNPDTARPSPGVIAGRHPLRLVPPASAAEHAASAEALSRANPVFYRCSILGSNASRRPSPSRLKASTVKKMARLGKTAM